LNAYHDQGKTGITSQVANRLLEILLPHGQVHISSERELEPEFEQYRIDIKALDFHHALYYSDLYIGDSQTIAAEAAVLGTPSVRFSDFVGKLEYLNELEDRYGLTIGVKTSEPDKLYGWVLELLGTPDLKTQWRARRAKMLSEKINVGAFISWFIRRYPYSSEIMQNDPTYQLKFQ